MAYPEGVDEYNGAGVIDWKQVRAAGVVFAIVKASQGVNFLDKYFHKNVEGCRQAGVLVGAYMFLNWWEDPVAQADNFLGQVDDYPGMVLFVDVERPGDGAGPYPKDSTPARRVAHVRACVERLRAVRGQYPGIYTYPYAWQECTGNSGAFTDDCPVWLARYQASPYPLLVPWRTWTVWQYTATGRVPGILDGAGNVDRNRWNGDTASLEAFFAPTARPRPRVQTINGHAVTGGFLGLWEKYGLAIMGYPLSDEYKETMDVPGFGRTTVTFQDWENVVTEWYPGIEPRIGAGVRRYKYGG